ncbi:unnamed protein product [Allacma fusca]|uniref:G-protein coupled receptors family 1 profile domain-containing protein n=1 Tax=Allacma fusca TaxID=39272 RepID=A0A8J2PKE2_9HEXA|nr:unnamed protein product [Allacma fusca]
MTSEGSDFNGSLQSNPNGSFFSVDPSIFGNRPMRTPRNIFMANISLTLILMCLVQLPFTLPEVFSQAWNFGGIACHLVSIARGVIPSVLTLTLMAITIDRYFLINYPTNPPLERSTAVGIISGIWTFAIIASLPMVLFTTYAVKDDGTGMCGLSWTSEAMHNFLRNFTYSTVGLQFVLPMIIMGICCQEFTKATNSSPADSEALQDTRRTNRMNWKYFPFLFIMLDAGAVLTTCFYPGLCAWFDTDFWNGCRNILSCKGNFGTTDLRGASRLEDEACNTNPENIVSASETLA